jgi:Mg-chelatase subunit ChlD
MCSKNDPNDDVLARLAECRAPFLIGVRHHSAALARVMPKLLADFRPKSVLVEMPPEFQPWLEYLGKSDLEAPVALAACDETRLISFYPLADFSPELAAIRWAATHNVPVIPCDLDLTAMHRLDQLGLKKDRDSDRHTALENLLNRFAARDSGELWEKLVETPASKSSPEAIRKAALYFGWMVRHSSHGPSLVDAHREAAMRAAVAAAPRDSVAVVGSYHAAALLPEPVLWSAPAPAAIDVDTLKKPATSLIPYSFAQLDLRSGYPAGVMDPVFQQTMLAATDPEVANRLIADLAVELCRQLRSDGHVAGTPDAIEIVRLARDLSRLRGHSAPGRGELLEAIETSLVQGDLLGRGRAVAGAAQAVLVGKQRGRLPKGTPKSGLAVQIEAATARLKLPGPDAIGDEPRELRLDPLRSRLDRGRAVLFRRLNLIGIDYARRLDTEAIGNRENLTEVWKVEWTSETTATVEAAGIHGVTLVQASEAAVRRLRHPDAAVSDDDTSENQHPATTLARLAAASECGLGNLVKSLLEKLDGPFLRAASAAQLIEAAAVIERIAAGHFAGLPLRADLVAPLDTELFEAPPELLDAQLFLDAALRSLDGLRGSDDPADVVALVDLTAIIRGDLRQGSDGTREVSPLLPALISHLARLEREGSPRMQGAAWGAMAMLDQVSTDRLGAILESWYDGASTSEGRGQLRSRLQGLMVPLLPLVSSEPNWLSGLEGRLESSTDDEFLVRLPALRGGFQTLTPADRARLLADRLAILEPGGPAAAVAQPIHDPVSFAAASVADRAGRSAIARLLPDFLVREPRKGDALATLIKISEPPGEITLADRWRLTLGVKGCDSAKGKRAASTLDQLYGASARAGRGQKDDLAGRGGTEAAAPSAREWVNDVQSLFSADVCEEVLGDAAAAGRAAVLEHLNPNTVRPSVKLLEQVLSLRGALPERELSQLRKLARRITERLAEQLANRLRPALSGLSTARPTRRPSRRLDFARTLDTNLDTAHRRDDGRVAVAPRHIVFRTPARRHMDWHLIFVVDVSGSMEASVIYSALVAGIFAALPAIDVCFFAFNTEVIDLSNSVDDPLALLIEVKVGGGTHIGLGLRAAREAIRNPTRTLVVLVTDFEEGMSIPEMLAEIRTLADSGAKLLGLAALDDDARPRYHTGNAASAAAAGMAVAAVSPERLAQWVGDQIRGSPS